MNLVVVGLGRFGSALSNIYEKQGVRVFKIQSHSSKAQITGGLLKNSIALLCVPTQKVPEAMAQRGDMLSQCAAIISTAKGLIQSTTQTPTEFIEARYPNHPPLLALSGPSFASELQKGQPTALVLAGKDKKLVDRLSQKLSTPQLRLYKCYDPHGVELCGALKNVYAIAAGMSEGLGFGDNTRAALTTRALAEMGRIGQALGGQPMTFFGLAGVGDLFLTCSSRQSRNFKFGLGLAQKKNPDTLLKKLGTVEGAWTAAVAGRLCARHGLRAPILNAVIGILQNKIKPDEALRQLMTRKVRHEFD